MKEQREKRFLIFMAILTVLAVIPFFSQNLRLNESARLENVRVNNIRDALDNLPILARAVSVYNVTLDKKIYGKNDQTPMPLASLTKTMTVLVALNDNKINDVVNIVPAAIAQTGDFGILSGEKWYLGDLAKATLIASANDGAFALSVTDPQFIEKMNQRAKKLGMEDTSFLNPTGLDIVSSGTLPQPGGLTSASDANIMAILGLREYPQIFWVTTVPELKISSISGFTHIFKNTDLITDKIPNLLFSKTGFTDLAGGNLTVILKNKTGEEIAVTILGSTYDGRFTDMESIVNVLYNM